jgi:hypothetical protein
VGHGQPACPADQCAALPARHDIERRVLHVSARAQ